MSFTPDIDGTGSGSLLEPDAQMHTCIFESSKLKCSYIGKPYVGPTVSQVTLMHVPGLFDSQHVILLLLFLQRSVCPSTLERRKGARLSPSRLFNGFIPFPQPRSYTCTHTETHAHTHTHTHTLTPCRGHAPAACSPAFTVVAAAHPMRGSPLTPRSG